MSKRAKGVEISPLEIARQKDIVLEMRATITQKPAYAMVLTYGCQQNEADSETIRGYLRDMGYAFTQEEKQADIIVINTCTVRESAANRVWGNLGALSHLKRENPNRLIVLCGCMAAQEETSQRIQKSFPQVDLLFSPHSLWQFPGLLQEVITTGKPVFSNPDSPGVIAEDLPNDRIEGPAAWLSIMYGCNNFCSYCIVPHVRGRERSRDPQRILEDIQRLLAQGVKDITLLGQNVNSYGADLDAGQDFSWLLTEINALPGDFLVRFMTSHPKDAGERLFATMAACPKVAQHIHLPVQAGNTRVLEAMNRGYTKEGYIALIENARRHMPGVVVTGDVIVGFPGETEAEFEDTLDVLEQCQFDALFTFIFSPRKGTPAAQMPDPVHRQEKQVWFDRLLALQNEISLKKHEAYVGKTLRLLVEAEENGFLKARTNGGRLVRLEGDISHIGQFVQGEITSAATWSLSGKILKG